MKLTTLPWLPAGLLIAGALLVSQAQAGFLEMPDTTEVPEMERGSMLKDLDIPTVRERDPDPNAGPRLNVTEFRVQGVVEYPELGITRESLNKLVESIRFDMMGEGEMLDSGYTLGEVSEISDLIAEIEEDSDDEGVGPLEVQRLVFLIRDQRRRRGVTVGMIENVADTITRYYRERGFILAKAYIPEQHVRDGVVTLTLLLGDLGEVNVLNNKRYKARAIEKIFNEDFGKPVTANRIEEKLYFVNDLPGLTAQAYFEPGSQVGDTRLNVNLVEERRFNANVRTDNHGATSTGEYRVYTDGYWHNPTGFGDQLHIGILGTFEPANSTYGALHYGIPVFGPRAKFTFGGSTNAFESTTLDGLTLTGDSLVLDATMNYILKRSRAANYSTELRYSSVETDITQLIQDDPIDDPAIPPAEVDNDAFDTTVNSLDLVFNFDKLDEKLRAVHQGGVRLTSVDIAEGRKAGQSEQSLVLAFNYSLLKFVKVPFTSAQSRLVINSAIQYADDALPSTSQFSLGGPSRMRGFDINTYNADRGAYLGMDWVFNSPTFLDFEVGGEKLNSLLQPYVFFDGGYGHTSGIGFVVKDEDPASETYVGPNSKILLADIGFGIKFSYKNRLHSSLTVAAPVHFNQDDGEYDYVLNKPITKNLDDLDYSSKVYFELQYSF